MRPKVRGLTKHGVPPGWLEESDPAGWDFVRDGRAVSPAFSVPHWLSWKELRADGISSCFYLYSIVNVGNHPSWAMSRKEGMAWYSSRPMNSLWVYWWRRRQYTNNPITRWQLYPPFPYFHQLMSHTLTFWYLSCKQTRFPLAFSFLYANPLVTLRDLFSVHMEDWPLPTVRDSGDAVFCVHLVIYRPL